MDNQLCQALRSLCFNTGWHYAIFWKLNHQVPMVLTLEDACYSHHEHHGPLGRSCVGQIVNNSLGFTLAKMSSHVYSLGEGVVGQVATTNKHLWISSEKYATDICSSLKFHDGWLTQLSAGIRTIAVVAVFPHGVVQLGSFNSVQISEDLNLVNHIRATMVELHVNIPGYNSSMDCSPCPFDEPCRSSVSRNYHDRIRTPDNEANVLSSVFLSLDELDFAVPQTEGCARKTEVTNMNQKPEKSISGVFENLDPLESHPAKSLQLNENFASKNGESCSGFWDSVVGTENNDDLSSLSNCSWEGSGYVPSMFYDHSQTSDQTGMLLAARDPQMNVKMDYKRVFEFHREGDHREKYDPYLNFSAGCELHEALGPKFKKRKTEEVVQIPDDTTSNSNLTTVNSCAEHLLEAVVAEACRKATEVQVEDTLSGSVKSLLTVEKVLEPPTNDTHGISSADYSLQQSSIVEENANYYFSTPGARDGSRRKANNGKKCRRRPRDRQLIQDRIKELRELVPHGSKCSIDSLLEQTIKHILFMQCTTDQAEKLDKCAESKLVNQETVTCGSFGNEHGSSWAMEVGNHLRVLPVTVENIDTSGQMLIKMLCEDCSPFLEIVKTIRSLGLTILKGGTEVYDGKTLIRYVVEGQNNMTMHRTDVLCSLLQILQQKAYV
ncbi:Transcription factor EMB1444 [Heracleum sosnowskyi]|uniref:Transcription factor EMB1444 n=1 Tax=Heracleum sosnowskyi TaxID=360622 RepID=A0AAD8HUI1_9APIA|nr:Transcription factor EMB1444 [Heracleum sosnowskyi]